VLRRWCCLRLLLDVDDERVVRDDDRRRLGWRRCGDGRRRVMLGRLSVMRSCRRVAGDRDRDDRDRAAGERDLGLCVAGLACRTMS
jgi:hypothetical protein